MEDVSKSTKPLREPIGSGFKNITKTTTFRVILPIIASAHLGWYYFRKHMVYDDTQHMYVYKENPAEV